MRFKKTFHVEVDLDIDKALIEGVLNDQWRSMYYKLMTPDDVANHIAYNIVANQLQDVRMLDGFADREMKDVRVNSVKWDED